MRFWIKKFAGGAGTILAAEYKDLFTFAALYGGLRGILHILDLLESSRERRGRRKALRRRELKRLRAYRSLR